MSKRKYRRKKPLSEEEKECRRQLAEERNKRIILERKRNIREIVIIITAFVLILAVIILSAVSDIFLILLLAAVIIFIFLFDKSGIRDFVFKHYPDSFPFAEKIKSHNPERAVLMELASTFSYYSLILILLEHKFSFVWTIIWLVCIITGFYYILTDGSEKYSLEKGAEFEDSAMFLFITPAFVFLQSIINIRINYVMILFTAVCCTAVTFIYAVSHKGNFSCVILVFIVSAICTSSGFLAVNKNLDFSEPREIILTVQDKDSFSGKSTSYYIYTQDWNNSGESIDIQVHRDIYYELENGDSVIIEIYKGSLGTEHYYYKEKASVN